MKRQFRGDRLYKIVKIIVLIISFISLIYAFYVQSQLPKISKTFVEEMHNCTRMFSDNNPEKNCKMWNEYLSGANNAVVFGYLIGIGLPLVFFGGGVLINYLFPKEKTK